jgi:hypothetical protein
MNTIKKTNTFIASAILISALLIMGCKKDFEEINTDPNSPSGILRVDFLLSGAEKGLMDFTWDAFWGAQTGILEQQSICLRKSVSIQNGRNKWLLD